jgi:hypothetical protein
MKPGLCGYKNCPLPALRSQQGEAGWLKFFFKSLWHNVDGCGIRY